MLAAGMAAVAAPAGAQRGFTTTYVPVPVTIGTGMVIRPRITGPYFSTTPRRGMPAAAGRTVTGAIPSRTPNAAARPPAALRRAQQPAPTPAIDPQDEARLAGAIGARLLRVEGGRAVIAVNAAAPLAGREAWVDVPTAGTRLAASRAVYPLGTVLEPGTEPGTYHVRMEFPAKEPGLVAAMPVWLLLPPVEATAAAADPDSPPPPAAGADR
jgi:hypothetical protein